MDKVQKYNSFNDDDDDDDLLCLETVEGLDR
jgi:hypothetical protein